MLSGECVSTLPICVEKKRKLHDVEEPTRDALKKLKTLQYTPLEENVDYITLQSSLSLLQARFDRIQQEVRELNQLKKCIRDSSSVKEVSKLVSSNSDYLKEIHYKGSYIKCPAVHWERDYGLEMDVLTEYYGSEDIAGCYERINEQYEIIKRDKLFN